MNATFNKNQEEKTFLCVWCSSQICYRSKSHIDKVDFFFSYSIKQQIFVFQVVFLSYEEGDLFLIVTRINFILFVSINFPRYFGYNCENFLFHKTNDTLFVNYNVKLDSVDFFSVYVSRNLIFYWSRTGLIISYFVTFFF